MTTITISVPDFSAMEDNDVAEHHLTSHLDGRWSALSRWLMEHFGTRKLDLNQNWASQWLGWECPCCKRKKIDIARISAEGVLICHLEEHHDHLGDFAHDAMRAIACGNAEEACFTMRRAACRAVLPLVERFAPTLVCADCNAADAAMKAVLGPLVHPSFSFSPLEIAEFIRPQSGATHELDHEVGRRVWETGEAQFKERVAFAIEMAHRIGKGSHNREIHGNCLDRRSYEDEAILIKLAREQSGYDRAIPHIGAAILARSEASGGHGSSKKARPKPSVRIPSDAEYATLDADNAQSPPWHRAGPDWECTCCGRNKRQIMRWSNKGRWTAKIMEISDFDVEESTLGLHYRRARRSEGTIFATRRTASICQDCRLLITNAKTWIKGLPDECLSPASIRRLAGASIAHQRHDVSKEAILAAVAADADWSEAALDFWNHRSLAGNARLAQMRQIEGLGFCGAEARAKAIDALVRERRIPGEDAGGCYDWLISENRRLG